MEKGIWGLFVAEEGEAPKEKGMWPTSAVGGGRLECMDYAVAIMFHLGNALFVSDDKIRVTIERDPEAGKFTIKREQQKTCEDLGDQDREALILQYESEIRQLTRRVEKLKAGASPADVVS
jgi:hypothetical protein